MPRSKFNPLDRTDAEEEKRRTCGARRGEPCFPDCTAAAEQLEAQAEIERDEDHDPFGDRADDEAERLAP
jgi:hypothetical protein